MYDLIIIGGGPAGVAAGVYAARKKLNTLLVTESFGGQSLISADIQNWIGTKSVSGVEFAKMLEDHVRAQESIEIKAPAIISKIEKKENHFIMTTNKSEVLETKAIILTSGSRRKKLNIPGEAEFDGKGVAYCSTCDAPIFKGKKVAVVGGGNAGLEAVLDLLPYATEIYLLEFSDSFKGDPVTLDKIKEEKNVHLITNAETLRIEGDDFIKAMIYKDRKTNEEKKIDLGGVFVEIGLLPNSEIVKDFVNLNKYGEIIINHGTAATNIEGIWAAGDVTDAVYKQNNIAAGDAIKAALSAYSYILQGK